ncbi:hypothetical protein BG005_007612 [Podila minutissima]|nr:hypothetical protein BG005_007612 [Podila minutissima]
MRIQWEPPPVATSANLYDALALPDPEQGDDSHTSNSPDTHNISTGDTTDDTTDMSCTTTTPQDTPQNTSSSERSLGNLGPVLSFLDLEKRGLRSERPITLTNPNKAVGSLGDFSQAFRYLKTQRHQVEAHRSPPEQHISSSSLSLLSSLLGTQVIKEGDKSMTFIIHRDDQGSREVPSPKPEKEKRKLKKKASRRILAIDEPSSSSGGGCASSESDQKETFAEKKTSMENVDVNFMEETKAQTDPKNIHAIENKSRTRRQAPTPTKKWHWTLRGTMTDMERLFRTERLAQEERRLEITTTTVKTRRQSKTLDSGTEDDDHRANSRPGFYHYYERMVPSQSPTLHHHHHLDKRDQDDDNTKVTILEASPSSPQRDEHSTDSEEEKVLYPRSSRPSTDVKPTKAASPTTPSTDCPTTTSTDMTPVKARPVMVKSRTFRPKFDYASFFSLLQRSRPTERRILVGSAPLFQELDVAMEYQYETKILRRVRKFVQGELGTVPVPVKQPRYVPSDALILSNNNYYNMDPSSGLSSHPCDKDARPSLFVPSGPGSGSGSGSGSTQGEQCVDELLHLKMLETILDHEPAVMVLATGDGGDSEFGGEGFYGVIKRALGRGWQVEIVSWEDQLSGVYIELAQEYKYPPENEHTGVYRPTYQQRGRYPSHPLQPSSLGRKGSLRIICLDWVGKQFTQSCE